MELNEIDLSQLGFELPTFRLQGEPSNALRSRRGYQQELALEHRISFYKRIHRTVEFAMALVNQDEQRLKFENGSQIQTSNRTKHSIICNKIYNRDHNVGIISMRLVAFLFV